MDDFLNVGADGRFARHRQRRAMLWRGVDQIDQRRRFQSGDRRDAMPLPDGLFQQQEAVDVRRGIQTPAAF
jgi:hypothetical protein